MSCCAPTIGPSVTDYDITVSLRFTHDGDPERAQVIGLAHLLHAISDDWEGTEGLMDVTVAPVPVKSKKRRGASKS
jgi:hypothetical protein